MSSQQTEQSAEIASLRGQLKEVVHVGGQMRVALAGYVSPDAAIHAWDCLPHGELSEALSERASTGDTEVPPAMEREGGMTNEEMVEAFIVQNQEGTSGCTMEWEDAQAFALALKDLREQRDQLADALRGLSASASALMDACDKAGAFDNLIAEVFPDAERRGTRADAGFAAIDRARNEMRAAQALAKVANERADANQMKGEI